MAQVLLLPGLGDTELVFRPWMADLAARGLTAKFIDTDNNGTFEDRVAALTRALQKELEPVWVIGHSAGGLATLVAALSEECRKNIRGIILVSPAIPQNVRGVWGALGWPLAKVMWKYEPWMILGRSFLPSEGDYRRVALNHVPAEVADEIAATRRRISGKEAAQLAAFFSRPRFTGEFNLPIVVVTGAEDQWVNPDAHLDLVIYLTSHNTGPTKFCPVPCAGHLVAHSKNGAQIVRESLDWLLAQT
ncbi:MAG TPA: alpha/beta fold hydrolase [Candidatus Paceibacterota bacterium]|nr:alpha/beta fold hydrolase [Candidatus Paceibacterota bacterium]